MSKVTAFITDGTEEAECLIAVDLLRRAGIDTELVSCNGTREVLSSHQIRIVTDKTFEEASFEDSDMLFIPGGMPGVTNLTAHEGLAKALKAQAAADKYIAAVCAGPSVLGGLGLLEGKKATCFPGWEDKLIGAECTGAGVTADGKILTGRGLGFSIDLALKMIEVLEGEEKALDIKGRIQHPETI
ncbi:4-methyl-5(b-hydroxyethyl)-thiazole monophosphate biosynthesis [Oscillospiraceae bacterium]|nr:4-methyl-5(b-hydroxyethyl)-thiazole monophosphate biosynthesis [Oscillospiraceae bacterium]